jgi:hypothetical protein
MATLTAFYSREIVIRCNNCKNAEGFQPDENIFDDPTLFKPFSSDSSDEKPPDQSSDRYTKGRR